MLSWIRNLHTYKAETFSWHSEFWLVLCPRPPQAHQELPHGQCHLFSALSLCCSLMGSTCWHGALPWAGTAGAASMDAMAHGTYCLCVGSDPNPLGGHGQLCCLLQDFREGQEIVEEQEPFTL